MTEACIRVTALWGVLLVLAGSVAAARAGTHSAMSTAFVADSWDWHVQSVGYALENGDTLKVTAAVTNQTGAMQTRWFGASVADGSVWYDDPDNDEQATIPAAGTLSVERSFRLGKAKNHDTEASVPVGTPLDVYVRFWRDKTSEVDYLMTGPISRLVECAAPVTWDGAISLAEAVYYELWRATTPDLADALPVSANASGRTAIEALSFEDHPPPRPSPYYYWVRGVKAFKLPAAAADRQLTPEDFHSGNFDARGERTVWVPTRVSTNTPWHPFRVTFRLTNRVEYDVIVPRAITCRLIEKDLVETVEVEFTHEFVDTGGLAFEFDGTFLDNVAEWEDEASVDRGAAEVRVECPVTYRTVPPSGEHVLPYPEEPIEQIRIESDLGTVPSFSATATRTAVQLSWAAVDECTEFTGWVAVVYTNEAPEVSAISVSGVDEGQSATLYVTLTDHDDATLSVTIDWGDGTVEALTDVPTGLFSRSHTYADDGADDGYTITVTATDLPGLSATSSRTVTVRNQPPTSLALTPLSGTEDTEYVGVLTAVDVPADPLTWTKTSGPGWLAVAPGGRVSGTPPEDVNGPQVLAVSVSDGDGGVTGATFMIDLAAVNDLPSFGMGPDQIVDENAGPQTVPGWATEIDDGDPEVAQALTFSVTTDNDGLFAAGPTVAANGTLTYTPADNANGVATVSMTLTDDDTAGGPALTTAAQTFSITVTSTAARDLWDLTGAYSTTVNASPLTLDLIHETSGKLSGTATYTVAKDTPVMMPIKGSVKGSSGSITMKGTFKGADQGKTVSVSLTLNLTVDTANRQLTGRLTGTVKSAGVTTAVNEGLALDIPGDMDGTWRIAFQLAQSGTAVTGTALLTLSNGVDYAFTAKGKTGANSTAILSLAGNPANPAARAIKIRTTVTPLEGGWARIEGFRGKGYGLALAW